MLYNRGRLPLSNKCTVFLPTCVNGVVLSYKKNLASKPPYLLCIVHSPPEYIPEEINLRRLDR